MELPSLSVFGSEGDRSSCVLESDRRDADPLLACAGFLWLPNLHLKEANVRLMNIR